MARAINKLTVRQVAALNTAGRHSDGGGLYLRITPSGSRSWLFMTTEAGRRQEISLGPAASVSLATARRLAGEMREAAATGYDPRDVLAAKPVEPAEPALTFGEFADQYISSVEKGWRNPVHRQQWRNSLGKQGADSDIFEAIDDAERAWMRS